MHGYKILNGKLVVKYCSEWND